MGSGNAGASNVTSELGWKYGIITGISDVLKAFIPTYLVVFIFPNTNQEIHMMALAGTGAVLGHIYPFFLDFRGGKGVACYIGMLLAINWQIGVAVIIGLIDHNSYEKDNETNWLNWNEREMNHELVDYYKGLIELRKQYSEFRHSKPEDFEFIDVGEKVAVAYILKDRFVVILNGENEDTLELDKPAGQWNILADEKRVNLENQQLVSNKIIVPPSSGIVLKRN